MLTTLTRHLNNTGPLGDPSGPAWLRRARALAVFVVLLAVGSILVPLAAQDDEEPDLDQVRAELEEVRRQQLEAAINLELLDVEDNQILAALEAVNELVEIEEARVEAAEQALAAAEARQAEAERNLLWAEDDIVWYQRQAVDYAVQSYMGLSGRRGETWMGADDATIAVHKVALLDLVSSDSADAVDQLRVVADQRDALVAESTQAIELAETAAAELESALTALESKYAVQLAVKAEFDARREAWQSEADGLAAAGAELEVFIREEEERMRLEAQRAAVAAGGVPTGVISESGWTWPTSGRIGSGFGQRLHPILGYYRQHDGLDIGGSQGQEIWAASGGIVLSAGWRGGFGNAVVIQHANNVTTVYAHMSSISVSAGDTVTTGDVIGGVGSTGLSTGPHLHFEVRVNGSAVDPRPYLP